MYFDSRSHALEDEKPHWDEQVKVQHRDGKNQIIQSLKQQFGERQIESKVENFRELGPLPMSVVSYHNWFFQQAREAFILGAYYPAATGACALAERILNHLIIDLRRHFAHTPEYKSVFRKQSFDDWGRAVAVLKNWNVLRGEVPEKFLELKRLRNRLIHFAEDTYAKERSLALDSLILLTDIITWQFGFFTHQRWWAIRGTAGAQFISKAAESDAFMKEYYLPRCPVVGPYYAIAFAEQGTLFFDRLDYPGREISDEEFADLHKSRAIADVASTELPLPANVELTGCLMRNGVYLRAKRASDGVGWVFE
jgi:hypothetical protein